jgi:hypothetical protein
MHFQHLSIDPICLRLQQQRRTAKKKKVQDTTKMRDALTMIAFSFEKFSTQKREIHSLTHTYTHHESVDDIK